MKIDVSSIKRIPGKIDTFQLTEAWDRPLEWQGEQLSFAAPLSITVNAEGYEGGKIFVWGSVEAVVSGFCSRCLEPLLQPVTGDFEGEFIPAKNILSENENDEFPGQHYTGDLLELEGLILESIYLHLPMQFLCSQECQGLCPQCGNLVALEPCNCDHEEVDPRFAILKQLINKE